MYKYLQYCLSLRDIKNRYNPSDTKLLRWSQFLKMYIRMKVLLSETAMRERLRALKRLDQLVTGHDEQLVDQDTATGRCRFPENILTSTCGHLPDNRALAMQHAEDEVVRRVLAPRCDRGLVGSVSGVTRRTTFDKQYHVAAYTFPLDELSRTRRHRQGRRRRANRSACNTRTSARDNT